MAAKPALQSDHAAVLVPPPVIFVTPLVAGFLLHQQWPWSIVGSETPIVPIVGVAGLFGGVMLGLSAVGTFKRRGTTVLPAWRPTRAVVTTGPYRYTRNPMYVGMALGYIGAAFLINSIWPLAFVPVVMLVVDRYVIAREEQYLRAKFGDEYAAYTRRVRRWL